MAAAHAITTSLTAAPSLCATTILPADGILQLGHGFEPLTLTEPATFHLPCPTAVVVRRSVHVTADVQPPSTDDFLNDSSLSQHDTDGNPPQSNWRGPFYTSPFPLAYALAATTITSYMLVIMLFITPRSFLDGGIVYLGRRGFTNSAVSGINIGGRPWLQKIAALTVAASLTVATVDTFKAAREQYTWGISDSKSLRNEVMGSTELKVIRLVSDTFLWLAQAQTLIRLFPRQKEKIIIKWAAFALIVLDVVFSAINSFKYSEDGVTNADGNPNDFVGTIPALSYIFQLSLGILYAAWVLYYAVVRKRYAFYHPQMRNICLVAIVSIIAILIPIVFFILDISKPDIAGWGDYVRWVGAAAASVVVWEWVERIEALEREDKKDGILGREVFDDELDFTSNRYMKRHKSSRDESSSTSNEGDDNDEGHDNTTRSNQRQTITWAGAIGNRQRQRPANNSQNRNGQTQTSTRPQFWPSRPAPVATPISRTDTTSAASTVYAVRIEEGEQRHTPNAVRHSTPGSVTIQESSLRHQNVDDDTTSSSAAAANHAVPSTQTPAPQHRTMPAPAARQVADLEAMEEGIEGMTGGAVNRGGGGSSNTNAGGWRSLTLASSNVFQRNREAPPAAVAQHATTIQQPAIRTKASLSSRSSRPLVGRWDLKTRVEEFAVTQAEKIREKIRPTVDTDNLPVMRIPAPARPGAALQQVLEEEEMQQLSQPQEQAGGSGSNGTSPAVAGRHSGDEQHPGNQRSPPRASGMSNLSRSRSGHSTTSRGLQQQQQHNDPPLPPNNPPLWPGVQPRYIYEDDEDDEEEGDYTDSEGSIRSRRSSMVGMEREGAVSGGPSSSGRR